MRSVLTTSDVGTWSFSCLAGNSIPKHTEPNEWGTRIKNGGISLFSLNTVLRDAPVRSRKVPSSLSQVERG